MRCYVNPKNETKEQFLIREGALISQEEARIYVWLITCKPVCWMNNGPFTAAAVCYNKKEFEAFSCTDDDRPKQWFLVNIEKLKTVSSIEDYL